MDIDINKSFNNISEHELEGEMKLLNEEEKKSLQHDNLNKH